MYYVMSVIININKNMDDQLKNWLCFNDNEIGSFQLYFFEYVKQNRNLFDDEKIYNFAILATEIQYNMRFVKELIYSNNSVNIPRVITFINIINKFPNLCEFISNKIIDSFNKTDDFKRYEYLNSNQTSYFNEEKHNIDKYWKKIITKINKYDNKKH